MALRLWPGNAINLARVEIELSPRNNRLRRIVRGLVVGAALAAGAAGHHVYLSQQFGQAEQQAVALLERQHFAQGLEQTRLQMRVAEAHGQGLERQVDTLNQRLQMCLEEVAFFRKAGSSKRPPPTP